VTAVRCHGAPDRRHGRRVVAARAATLSRDNGVARFAQDRCRLALDRCGLAQHRFRGRRSRARLLALPAAGPLDQARFDLRIAVDDSARDAILRAAGRLRHHGELA
jgi:hypothetical protein